MAESRIEILLNALLNGETLEDFVPRSRTEKYLLNCVKKCGCEGVPKPISRLDALCYALADKISNAGMTVKEFLTIRTCEGLFNELSTLTYEKLATLLSYDDTSEVTNMKKMFRKCTALKTIPPLNTSKVTDTSSMFYECSALENVPELDTSNSTDTNAMFYNCSSLVKLPEKLDTSKSTTVANMFQDCSALTEMPPLDFSKATSVNALFSRCSALTEIPPLDFSKATSAHSLFNGCTLLEEVKILALNKNLTEASSMYCGCNSLKKIPQINTEKVQKTGYMFSGCYVLEEIPEMDMRSCTYNSLMFNNCYALKKLALKNIKKALQIGSGEKYGHLIEVNDLVKIIYELLDTGSLLTLTVGSANLTKLAGVYVKTVEITDEMRAEDDLIDQKLPFVVCESTDEGASLITDYVKFKNWQLK